MARPGKFSAEQKAAICRAGERLKPPEVGRRASEGRLGVPAFETSPTTVRRFLAKGREDATPRRPAALQPGDAAERFKAQEAELAGAIAATVDQVLKEAKAEKDPERKMRLLKQAAGVLRTGRDLPRRELDVPAGGDDGGGERPPGLLERLAAEMAAAAEPRAG